jgi:hypothetical protein
MNKDCRLGLMRVGNGTGKGRLVRTNVYVSLLLILLIMLVQRDIKMRARGLAMFAWLLSIAFCV